ncbi:hypothetical protein X805_20700 [Sphaerotilus natans subsp. natans DSM 6575]|uniref:Uncharacterized protein n=1 Tax=Sphaerotilus natans subsp. natans DSM 6575 TaxID=1286631 RepID=A0A059KLH6_9BURK|nr:hypothetical protein X805_20700 [Sphaerotilus natans subsp. natans DSM 6575]
MDAVSSSFPDAFKDTPISESRFKEPLPAPSNDSKIIWRIFP